MIRLLVLTALFPLSLAAQFPYLAANEKWADTLLIPAVKPDTLDSLPADAVLLQSLPGETGNIYRFSYHDYRYAWQEQNQWYSVCLHNHSWEINLDIDTIYRKDITGDGHLELLVRAVHSFSDAHWDNSSSSETEVVYIWDLHPLRLLLAAETRAEGMWTEVQYADHRENDNSQRRKIVRKTHGSYALQYVLKLSTRQARVICNRYRMKEPYAGKERYPNTGVHTWQLEDDRWIRGGN